MEPFVFAEPSEETFENSYRLLDIQVTGLDCGDEPANWVSSFLGEDLRLVKHFSGDLPRRPPAQNTVKYILKPWGQSACLPMQM